MKKLTPCLVAAVVAAAFAGSAYASPEEAIAAGKCKSCHGASDSKKGPAWSSLAKKYAGDASAKDKLFTELKAGGKVGNEEDHKAVKASDADIKAIVDIVLSSK